MNMKLSSKRIFAPLMVASFMLVALFGFVAMSYGSDGRMEGDCPFSATGAALCPQDALIVAMHHISAYQSFLNVPVDSTLILLMGILLLAVYLLVLIVRPLLFIIPARLTHFSHGPPISARTREITRWLSLLENSPSVS